MVGVDGDMVGPLAKSYARKGDNALLGMMHDWARSVQTGAGSQPSCPSGEEAAMEAMRDVASRQYSLPLNCLLESFKRVAAPLPEYVFERFPGVCASSDAARQSKPGLCSGYRGSLPKPEQRKNFAAEIIRVLGP